MRFLYAIIYLVLIVYFFANSPYVQAASKGITVNPSILKIDLDTDPTEAIFYYTNTINSHIELSFKAQDFRELEEIGRVRFIDEAEDETYRYSLSSWINFERQSLSLAPGETGELKLLIDEAELTPGAHYASIQAEISQDSRKGQVKLRGIISSLLFVRTSTGLEYEDGKIQSLSARQNFLLLPDSFILRFQNSGNVDLEVHGVLLLKDHSGEVVAKGIVNEDSMISLPESNRRYGIPISSLSSFILPGIYDIELKVNFGKAKKELFLKQTLFTVGTNYTAVCGLIILLIFATGIFFTKKKLSGKISKNKH